MGIRIVGATYEVIKRHVEVVRESAKGTTMRIGGAFLKLADSLF